MKEIEEDVVTEIYAQLAHLEERQDRIVECLQEIENIFKTITADISNIVSKNT